MQAARFWSARVVSTRHRGNETRAAATWTLSEASHSDANRSGSLSMTKGGSVSKSK